MYLGCILVASSTIFLLVRRHTRMYIFTYICIIIRDNVSHEGQSVTTTLYICVIYIYSDCFNKCPRSIPLFYIVILFYNFNVAIQSTLLNYANPCRNLTFQLYARAAEKKELNGTN